jgi:hypothetical protein
MIGESKVNPPTTDLVLKFKGNLFLIEALYNNTLYICRALIFKAATARTKMGIIGVRFADIKSVLALWADFPYSCQGAVVETVPRAILAFILKKWGYVKIIAAGFAGFPYAPLGTIYIALPRTINVGVAGLYIEFLFTGWANTRLSLAHAFSKASQRTKASALLVRGKGSAAAFALAGILFGCLFYRIADVTLVGAILAARAGLCSIFIIAKEAFKNGHDEIPLVRDCAGLFSKSGEDPLPAAGFSGWLIRPFLSRPKYIRGYA